MKISAVVVTYNNEKKIIDCLESLQGVVDEIIIVDSQSPDLTRKIAAYFTDKVYQHSSTEYAELKNFGQMQATFDWILSLEPDERLSRGLKLEILKIKQSPDEAEGYYIPRRSFYLGRWVRHSGWYPNRRVRLYKKEKGCWVQDRFRVTFNFSGQAGRLKNPVEHLAFSSIAEHLNYLNRISGRRAQEMYLKGKKARFYHLWLWPFFRFFGIYFGRGGWLDGFPGLVISMLAAYGLFLKYAKLKEVWKKGERIEPVSYSQ
ncbi:MAG: glycosyltransferase family 2 protein [Candidatus Saccharicenans sp.]|uniref:glycosyltransferase family 2 protein n=1 Tax=Candidatus Saccharicenans sp. TaxID=2819258 RepID=UPI00404B1C22